MKKILAMLLASCLLLSLGTAALAIADNPSGRIVPEVPQGDTMNNNAGTVTDNNGTVTTNVVGGVVTTNHDTGTVTNNNGKVTTNEGTVTTNAGLVADNNNWIETNTSNGTITNNNAEGAVTNNAGTVMNNAGYVEDNLLNGVVVFKAEEVPGENEGTVVNNAGTVTNAKIDESTGNIVYGDKTLYGVTYDGSSESVEAGSTHTVESAGTRSGYTFGGWKVKTTDGNSGLYLTTYKGGEEIPIVAPVWFAAIWNVISSGNTDGNVNDAFACFYREDDDGVSSGDSFTVSRAKADLLSVSIDGISLTEGVDYEIVETADGIVINFLPALFEKYGAGPFTAALLFNGNVCYVFTVTSAA